jgi:hypothetical protein
MLNERLGNGKADPLGTPGYDGHLSAQKCHFMASFSLFIIFGLEIC